jgi:hypothetical protein
MTFIPSFTDNSMGAAYANSKACFVVVVKVFLLHTVRRNNVLKALEMRSNILRMMLGLALNS